MRLRRQDGRISVSAAGEGVAFAAPPAPPPSPVAAVPPVPLPGAPAPERAPYRSIGEILVAMDALPAAGMRGGSPAPFTPAVPAATFRPATGETRAFDIAPPPTVDPLVVVVHNPADPFAATVVQLHRVVEQARWRAGRIALRLGVVGVNADGPAALVSANLAAQAALSGTRTLLVDGNLATPVHDRLFGVHRQPGLVEVLDGRVAPADAAHPSVLAGLAVLPTGTIGASVPALAHGRLSGALAALQGSFELIVVDASRGDADAIAACEGLEAVVLVVARGEGSAVQAAELGRWLQSRGIMLAGSVTID